MALEVDGTLDFLCFLLPTHMDGPHTYIPRPDDGSKASRLLDSVPGSPPELKRAWSFADLVFGSQGVNGW